jgi:peptidoglycan LD-endopeptidase CwlK
MYRKGESTIMVFVMKYDKINRERLSKLAPNTKVAAMKFYDYCIKNKIDILIVQTVRTLEEQKANVAKGVSQTLKSYHLVGQALDFVPIVNGDDDWRVSAYQTAPIKKAVAYAKSIGFEYGGDWKSFKDYPHLQYNYKGYGTDKVLEKAPVKQAAAKPASTTTYKVVAGDTLTKIGKKFNISVSELKSLNGLKSDLIRVGQVLKVKAAPVYYTVVKGDYLGKIAIKYNTSVSAIKALNGLKSDLIKIGQKLRVK